MYDEIVREEDEYDYKEPYIKQISHNVSNKHLHIVGEKDENCGDSSNDNNEDDYVDELGAGRSNPRRHHFPLQNKNVNHSI